MGRITNLIFVVVASAVLSQQQHQTLLYKVAIFNYSLNEYVPEL
jgi:hypothetical protein